MKYIIIGILLTTGLISCRHKTPTQQSHSCPGPGHGPCFLCDESDAIDKQWKEFLK